MTLIFIRHGEPDYVHDSLTAKGFEEAELLSDALVKLPIDAIYVSPLGRAKATARATLERKNAMAILTPWLTEFTYGIPRKDMAPSLGLCWDWCPKDWEAEPKYFDKDQWCHTPVMIQGGIPQMAEKVYEGFDAELAKYGYVREGLTYKVVEESRQTLCFFGHFGTNNLLIAHLLNISPMVLWHDFIMAPSSITVLHTEEREK